MIKEIEFYAPANKKELFEIIHNNRDTHLIAGGTDLIININKKKVSPDIIVNLKSIEELDYIKEEGGIIKIGATATHSQIADSLLVKEEGLALAQACKSVGSTQIRNLGTIGGNIVNASPAADSVAALLALDASVLLESLEGKRKVRISDLHKHAGGIDLNKDEVLTEISFKSNKKNIFSYFVKFGLREALAIVELSVTAVMEIGENNFCKDAKISIGAIERHPVRARCVEKKFVGKQLSLENIEDSIEKMSEFTAETLFKTPFKDLISYKKQCIKGVSREVFEAIYYKAFQK